MSIGENILINRKKLYRFPWSNTDNPGAWVEVTDECNLQCQGCYRAQIEGHKSLEEIKADILLCQKITNCDGITISGGEPLIYPNIIDVVDFISKQKMKPMIFTNGEPLTWELASELKKAGLGKIHFHIDSGQERPPWTGKTEIELNILRQKFADMIWELGGVQCGFHVTVYRSNLQFTPDVIDWCWKNFHKVQHISLIAFRGLPLTNKIKYLVNGKKIDIKGLPNFFSNLDEINITTEEIYKLLIERFPKLYPCAYINGTTAPQTNKYLVFASIGSKGRVYGGLGAKSLELVQTFYHLFKNKYPFFMKSSKVGKKVFALSMVDKKVSETFRYYLGSIIRNPFKIFNRIYTQSMVIQQPFEIIDGKPNHCDGCVNTMIYNGKMIHSCRLDEYRLFGSLIRSAQQNL